VFYTNAFMPYNHPALLRNSDFYTTRKETARPQSHRASLISGNLCLKFSVYCLCSVSTEDVGLLLCLFVQKILLWKSMAFNVEYLVQQTDKQSVHRNPFFRHTEMADSSTTSSCPREQRSPCQSTPSSHSSLRRTGRIFLIYFTT
jgi:hypothetical protein